MSNNKFIDKVIDDIITEASRQYVDEMFDEIEKTVKDENIVFSKEHQKNVDYILKGKYKKDDIKIKRPLKFNKKMFFVAVVVMTIVLGSVIGVDAVKVKIINFILEIEDKGTDFKFFSQNSSYNDIATSRSNTIKLHYIPKDFKLVDSNYSDNEYSVEYRNNENYFLVSKSNIPDMHSIDTENAQTRYVEVNGKKAFLSTKDGLAIIFWTDENFLYNIYGNISEECIINIAKNME